MNKKGFTLVELLGVLVIIGILFTVAMVGYNKLVQASNYSYYKSTEQTILVAANEFYKQNKLFRPIGDEISAVTIRNLVDGGFIDEIKDTKGNSCYDGYVYARVSGDNSSYSFDVCMKNCGDVLENTDACKELRKSRYRVDITTLTKDENQNPVIASYDGNSGDWANNAVYVNFVLQNNDITDTKIKDKNNNEIFSCKIEDGKDCVYTHLPSNTPQGETQYSAEVYTNGELVSSSKYKILLDTTAPVVTLNLKKQEIAGKLTNKIFYTDTETEESAWISYDINVKKTPYTSNIKDIQITINSKKNDGTPITENYTKKLTDLKSTGILGLDYTYTEEIGLFSSDTNIIKVKVTDRAGNQTIITSDNFLTARKMSLYSEDKNKIKDIYVVNGMEYGYRDPERILGGIESNMTFLSDPTESLRGGIIGDKSRVDGNHGPKLYQKPYFGCKLTGPNDYKVFDEISAKIEIIGDTSLLSTKSNKYSLNIYNYGKAIDTDTFDFRFADPNILDREGLSAYIIDKFDNKLYCQTSELLEKNEYRKQTCHYREFDIINKKDTVCNNELNNTLSIIFVDGKDKEILSKISCESVYCELSDEIENKGKNCYNNTIVQYELDTCTQPINWQSQIIYPGVLGGNDYVKVEKRTLYKIIQK